MTVPFVFRDDALKGKVAVVTGGASGIGWGISQRLAMAGANVVIASRRVELCVEAAQKLEAEYGVKAVGLGLNVRDSAAVDAMFAEAADKMGGIDTLVNNAAGNFYYPAHRLSDNQWKAVMEIDLYGTFFCSRSVCKYLRERGGTIVSISMTLHHNGWVGMAPACAAKAGIDALTKTLALEWAPWKIRVNAIAPGPIITEGVKKAFQLGGDFESQRDTIPLCRAGEPEEIGNMVVFLASEAGAWVTGSIYVMDGGESLSPRRAGLDPEALDQMADMMKDAMKG